MTSNTLRASITRAISLSAVDGICPVCRLETDDTTQHHPAGTPHQYRGVFVYFCDHHSPSDFQDMKDLGDSMDTYYDDPSNAIQE